MQTWATDLSSGTGKFIKIELEPKFDQNRSTILGDCKNIIVSLLHYSVHVCFNLNIDIIFG